jgi:CheY-like chemotaxis protein
MRVLVCDDNADAPDTLAVALQMHGHDVKVFYDGQDCLNEALNWKPAVAFLDIGMPRINGYDMARQLRDALGPGILLVAVTAYNNARALNASREAGFDMHLPNLLLPSRGAAWNRNASAK